MWYERYRSVDDPRLVELLCEVRDIANQNIIDECSRNESEPYISIWEYANRCLKSLNAYESGK